MSLPEDTKYPADKIIEGEPELAALKQRFLSADRKERLRIMHDINQASVTISEALGGPPFTLVQIIVNRLDPQVAKDPEIAQSVFEARENLLEALKYYGTLGMLSNELGQKLREDSEKHAHPFT